jgi:hypothetical protein
VLHAGSGDYEGLVMQALSDAGKMSGTSVVHIYDSG